MSQGQYLSPTLTWDVRLQVEWLANTLYPHLTRVCDTGSDVEPMDMCFVTMICKKATGL